MANSTRVDKAAEEILQTIGFSGVTDEASILAEETYGANHYERLATVVRRTEGAWLYNKNGEKILDCLAAYSAANPGHHHPRIVAAVVDALAAPLVLEIGTGSESG